MLKVAAPGRSSVWSKNPFARQVALMNAFPRTAAGVTQVQAFSAAMPAAQPPTDVIAYRPCEVTHGVVQRPPLAVPDPAEAEAIQAAASHPLVELVAEVKALRQTLDLVAKVLASTRQPRAAGRAVAVRTVTAACLAELDGKKLLDIRQVEQLVCAKRSTIYGWMKAGKFVMPVRTSPKASRWIASEVEAWLDGHKASRDSSPSSACSTTPAVETGRIANFT